MSAIPAVSRKVSTLVDGTLRLTIDIEPMHAQDAFALFGAGNVPMALAALNVGVAIPEAETGNPVTEMKGGELARLAGQLIRNPEFQEWLGVLGYWVDCAEGADSVIKHMCAMGSKRELDHEPQIAERFHRLVRIPFVEWQQQRNGRAA